MRSVLCLLFALCVLTAPARAHDPCTNLDKRGWSFDPYTLTDARVVRIFNAVYARSGIRAPVRLCEYVRGVESPHAIKHYVSRLKYRAAVFMPEYFVDTATDDELRGVFAHELGHIYLLSLSMKEALLRFGRAPSFLSIEIACDAFGARLVGARAVLQGMHKVIERMRPTQMVSEQPTLMDKEISERTKELLASARVEDESLNPPRP